MPSTLSHEGRGAYARARRARTVKQRLHGTPSRRRAGRRLQQKSGGRLPPGNSKFRRRRRRRDRRLHDGGRGALDRRHRGAVAEPNDPGGHQHDGRGRCRGDAPEGPRMRLASARRGRLPDPRDGRRPPFILALQLAEQRLEPLFFAIRFHRAPCPLAVREVPSSLAHSGSAPSRSRCPSFRQPPTG